MSMKTGVGQKGPVCREFGFYFVSCEKLSELSDIFKVVFWEYQICTIWIQGGKD